MTEKIARPGMFELRAINQGVSSWGGEMKQTRVKWTTLILVLAAVMMLGACKKKVAPPPPPPPPPPPAPTASLSANPNTVQKGQAVTLTWQTANASDVSIDGVGTVQPSGTQQVTPADSTTYHLVAKGSGGTQEATARVTVTAPPPPPALRRPSLSRSCFLKTLKMFTSTMTRPISVLTSSLPCRQISPS